MIYTKSIEEISWDDIDAFCQERVGEGAYLDYKEDFPNQLEKTISAMANTFGGIILIGIEEDDNKRPLLPIKGIPFQRGLSERVTSIILTNITPPVFPEIQVCRRETDDKAIVVIRIPQSHQTPHAILSNTRVYLRTGDINKPEELATIDQIAWLTNQRSKAVTLRENLYQNSKRRYSTFYGRALNTLSSEGMADVQVMTGILTLSVCPTYPYEQYRNPSQLAFIYENIAILDYFGTMRYFPPKSRGASTVQDGAVSVDYENKGERVFYAELNSYGLYFYGQPIKRISEKNMLPMDLLSAGEILARIDQFLDSARKFYDEIGYWGYVDLKISLTGIEEVGLYLDWILRDDLVGVCPDKDVVFARTILAGNIEAEKEQLLFESMQKLSWAFDIHFSPEYLEHFRKKFAR
jgi:hypothetical protein